MLSSLSTDKKTFGLRKVHWPCKMAAPKLLTKSQISHSLEQAMSLGTFSKSQTSEKAQWLTDQHDVRGVNKLVFQLSAMFSFY